MHKHRKQTNKQTNVSVPYSSLLFVGSAFQNKKQQLTAKCPRLKHGSTGISAGKALVCLFVFLNHWCVYCLLTDTLTHKQKMSPT